MTGHLPTFRTAALTLLLSAGLSVSFLAPTFDSWVLDPFPLSAPSM